MHRFPLPNRSFWRAGWLLVFLFALAGCQLSQSPSAVIGALGPEGGWLEGPDGLAVTQIAGALETTLAVTLEAASRPSLPLPEGVEPAGSTYRIAADRDAPASEPFVLVVPLPQGADPTTMAVAVYHPGGVPHVPDPMWFRLPGIPAPELNAFLVLLPKLPSEGLIFLPVRDTTVELPAEPGGTLRPAGTLGQTWLAAGKAIVTPKGAFSTASVRAFEAAFTNILKLYANSKLRPPLLQVVGGKTRHPRKTVRSNGLQRGRLRLLYAAERNRCMRTWLLGLLQPARAYHGGLRPSRRQDDSVDAAHADPRAVSCGAAALRQLHRLVGGKHGCAR